MKTKNVFSWKSVKINPRGYEFLEEEDWRLLEKVGNVLVLQAHCLLVQRHIVDL